MAQFTVGVRVYLADQLDKYAQTAATIIAYDYTSQPRCYLIRFADGTELWLREVDISLYSA